MPCWHENILRIYGDPLKVREFMSDLRKPRINYVIDIGDTEEEALEEIKRNTVDIEFMLIKDIVENIGNKSKSDALCRIKNIIDKSAVDLHKIKGEETDRGYQLLMGHTYSEEFSFENIVKEDIDNIFYGRNANKIIENIGSKYYPRDLELLDEYYDKLRGSIELYFHTYDGPVMDLVSYITKEYDLSARYLSVDRDSETAVRASFRKGDLLREVEDINRENNLGEYILACIEVSDYKYDICEECSEGVFASDHVPTNKKGFSDKEKEMLGFKRVDDRWLCGYCYESYMDEE